MRPHHLALTAFGPFAATVEVDLDALSGGGVFLLHGETGAGKTTLLDALGFALYGRVPGERGKAKRLRSDHASGQVRTAVVLVVTLAGRRLRITRSPQQDKPSSRGGSTVAPAKVQLDELVGGAWECLSTRVGEADAEISDLMGMSAEQFFQVVLLPQGEFASFLRADAAKRGELLARLFGTARYGAVEDWLADRRRTTAAEVTAAEHDLQVLAARLAQVAGQEPPVELASDWGGLVQAELEHRAETSSTVLESCRVVLAAARADAERADLLATAQGRRALALERQAQLARSAPDRAALASECAAADRAGAVRPRIDDLDRRERVVHDAQAAAAAARAQTGQRAADLPDALTSCRTRVNRLEALQSVADALARQQTAVHAATAEVTRVDQAWEAGSARAALLPAHVEALEERLRRRRTAEVALPSAVAALGRLGAVLVDRRAWVIAVEAADVARDELTLARESAVALREKALEVREARVDSMVAELAFHLEPGAPCPVCGGVEHPDPSLLTGARVTRDDEDRAQAEHDHAQRVVEDAATRSAAAAAAAAELAQRLGEHAATGVADLEQQVRALDAAVSEHRQRVSDGAALEDELSRLLVEQRDLAVELSRLDAERAAASRRAADAAEQVTDLAAQLASELDGATDLPTALEAAAARVLRIEQAIAAEAAATSAQVELVAAAAAAVQAAAEAGFDEPAQARAALRAPDWLATTRRELLAAEREEIAVAAVLADPSLAVPLSPPAPVDLARQQLAAAVSAHEAAAAEAATAAAAAGAAAELAPQVHAALQALLPVRARADEVRRLADLAAGTSVSNALRMSLSSFVLAARLEEVALAASERLLRMTQGRFSLIHTDAGRGGGRAGLGLLARDTWTGQDRETSTLSGGETFLASLALALGLADVVAAEAGGARIEALFVDEGFGTLDEETLDEVMDVLDGLREGGRVVGVVSHVAELRQRIPSQVQVRKGRSGSTLEVVHG